MNEKFEKFNEQARNVLTLAQQEARRFNHNYIGAEHLLLGLVRDESCVGARALAEMGAEPAKVRHDMELIIGRGDRAVLGEIGLTPRAKKVIELAVDEARRMGHHYIGAEHLLLGLVREGESIAAVVLERNRVTLEEARRQIQTLIQPPGGPQAPRNPWNAMMSRFNPGVRAPDQSHQLVAVLTLICRNVDATLAFYVDILSAESLPTGSDQARSFGADTRFVRLPNSNPAAGVSMLALRPANGGAPDAQHEVGSALLTFVTSDIAATHARLQARGATTLSEVSDAPDTTDTHEFTITDPDGRSLRFVGPHGS